jgi:hypothetical protein
MRSIQFGIRGRRAAAVILALAAVPAFTGFAAGAGQSEIAKVRQATVKYRDVDVAIADGYAKFHICTEEPGVGAMGQHFVKGSLVEDPAINALHPEVLVYVPKRNGDWELVAVEYVTLAPLWDTAFPGQWPTVLGQDLLFREAGNRYGLPDFYELHAWIWQGNPSGMFEDWNPSITCLGTGDNGG